MSHNPNTIKSQDDINEGGRKSDVLIATIEELERTKKQLECGVNRELLYLKKIEKVDKQLAIAIKALRGVRVWANTGNGGEQAVKKLCDKVLQQIEESNK